MKLKMKGAGRKVAGFLLCVLLADISVYASVGENYITISVDAADDNGQLMYALDSDAPDAFTTSNEFSVPAGTSHTIYVRDAAGNITSQVFEPQPEECTAVSVEEFSVTEGEGQDQQINIELEIGEEPSNIYEDYEYLTDTPVEPGLGTVHSKVLTDGSNDSSKIFYTITTAEGEVFYMIIDQSQSSDNVYLLDQVTIPDLEALASPDTTATEQEKEKSLLEAMAEPSEEETAEIVVQEKNEGSSVTRKNLLIVLIVALIGGGYYYYTKVYKNKKEQVMDAMDAMDMDDFGPEEDEDEEEVEFDIDEEEKQRFIDGLMEEEDEPVVDEQEYLNIDPEEYFQDEYEEDSYSEDIAETLDDDSYEPEMELDLDEDEEDE